MAYGGGGFLPGGGAGSLEDRKKQLLQWLAGRGASSPYAGAGSAVGRMGGIGGRGPLPQMSYNPFLAQIAGRNENFPFLPAGLASSAAQAVQQGPVGPGMGLITPPGVGGPPAGGPPGLGAVGGLPDAAPGVVQAPQPAGGAAGRNLIGVAPPPPPVAQQPFNPTVQAPALQPWNPFNPLARAQSAGVGYRE